MFEPPLLFRNRGDGTFVDVATARGIDLDAGANAATWADIDNDGDADLIIGTVGAPRSFLYVNDGSGHFSEEALARGVAWPTDAPHWEVGVAVGDYDRDGWVDIYFAGWGIFRRSPSRLLRNRGAEAPGQFEDVTAASGADVERLFEPFVTAFSPAFVDLDGDGFQDLAVTAEPDQTRLFWNQGDGTFRDGTVAARVNRAGSTMGMTFGDLDFDGRLDWFISNLTCTDPYQPRQGPVEDFTPHQCGNRNNLFMSTSGREFTDRSFDFGLAIGHFGWGTGFTDYDNDGDLDLAFVNGLRVPFEGFENYHHDPMRFWRNDGAGEMVQVAGELGLLDQGIGSGLVLFDYDGDGDEDLYIVNVDGPPRLYRNDGGNRLDWIEVEVVGTTSNRDGLGARVTVQAHAGAPRQLQEIGARTHYLGQSDRVARFGLGSGEESVAEVRVDWPASGTTQTFREVARNQRIVVVEGDGGLE